MPSTMPTTLVAPVPPTVVPCFADPPGPKPPHPAANVKTVPRDKAMNASPPDMNVGPSPNAIHDVATVNNLVKCTV